MRARLSAWRPADLIGQDLTPLQVMICAFLLFASDWTFRQAGTSLLPGGPLDEVAHLLTALLLLQALPPRQRARLGPAALFASVAIDLDHVPQYLGQSFLTVGTPRPYSHSLLTIALLLGLGLLAPRGQRVFLGLALGVALHFFRDLSEGAGGGVALLWPVSLHVFNFPHSTYLALMACVVAADLGLGMLSLRRRPAVL